MSASPFRATVKIEAEESEQSDEYDEEFDRQSNASSFLTTYSKARQPSPIRDDSQSLRSRGEQTLNNFGKLPKNNSQRL